MFDPIFASFTRHESVNLLRWSGNPDCQTAHDAVLAAIRSLTNNFLPSVENNDNIVRGNLGETITFCLSASHECKDCMGHFANALRPFSGKSNPEIDLLWAYFGNTEAEDWVLLQEVKTTTQLSISYANTLVDDYHKLFGVNSRVTLHTRMQDFKNRLQYEREVSPNILARVNKMAGKSPRTCNAIRLIPTVLHDKAAIDVETTMIAVRDTLIGDEWSNVAAWAIELSDLDSRLCRLATGKS